MSSTPPPPSGEFPQQPEGSGLPQWQQPQQQGAPQYPVGPQFAAAGGPFDPTGAAYGQQTSQKDFVVAWLLALFLGALGADRFYRGFIGLGVLKLVTCGGAGIWALVDLIIILATGGRDKNGLRLKGFEQRRKVAWIVTGAVILISMVSSCINGITRIDVPAPESAEVVATEPAVVEEKVAEEAPTEESSPAAATTAEETTTEETTEEEPAAEDVPAEYTSALNSAQDYSDLMHMSKQGLFDQLTSEYADQFSDEAAQYAVDNVEADWNENALKSAESYSETMHMSKQGIYDQLTSEYGEKFEPDQAQYAIDNIEADWNANALASAENYRDSLDMSPEAIRDQLSSEYGEKFTQEEADYAVDHLDD